MDNIYLAIQIDGNAATAMAATKDSEGRINPIATETQTLNIRDTHNGIISLEGDVQIAISQLQSKIMNKIEGANNELRGLYLGIMPRSLHGEPIEVRKEFDGKHRITDRDIENLGKEIAKKINNKIIMTCDNGYLRDGVESMKVRDELADTLIRKSLAVVVTPHNDVKYSDLMNSGTKMFGFIPTHIAIGKVVTDEEQRVNGVIAMHIGRQSSGMTYFCNDMVMATAVIPFGFDHVLHDMCQDEITMDKAEWFVNSANMRYSWDSIDTKVRFGKEESAPSYHVAKGVEAFMARLAEIFKLGHDRMAASLNMESLDVPVVMTTTVMESEELCEALKEKTGHEFMRGNAVSKLKSDRYEKFIYIPLVALINEAKENCIAEREMVFEPADEPKVDDKKKEDKDKKEKKEKEKKDRVPFWKKYSQGITLFDGKEDDFH